MNPAEFARVKEILIAARELPREDRAAFLDRECGDDRALRAEVDSLLAHETGAPSLIGTGGLGRGLGTELPRSLARALGEDAPDRIGPYRILEVLGEGGMGTVYRAEQAEPIRREVALKLVRRGLDGTRAAARFEVERRALAMMDHPNIAKVLDAGTDKNGRPYFVMELVRGAPITAFCDRERLSVRERVELMIPVCRAVQHAHRKGILHRDLKPSNVLVTLEDGKPAPKVIDFGIAKAVQDTAEPGTLLTAEGQLVGTPEYMSPEQAGVIEAEVDTRTDVYALGVVLYELLTGRRPHRFRNATPVELHRVLSREEPERPSTACSRVEDEPETIEPPTDPVTPRDVGRARGVSPTRLRRELSGDLDTMVLMALRREPERRYGSAEHFAEDLRRYLDGLPVLARKDTLRYRAGKFARRHRVAVGAAAFLALFLAGLAVTMTVQSARVARERDRALAAEARARTEAETAGRVTDFLVDLFDVSDPSEARGNTITAREILDRGSARIQGELADQPGVKARLLGTLGRVYSSLGLYPEARPLAEESLRLRRSTYGEESPETARGLADLASVRSALGDFDASDSLYRAAQEVVRRTGGEETMDMANVEAGLAGVLHTRGRLEEAGPLYRDALAISRRVKGPESAEAADAMGALASFYHGTGEVDSALVLLRRTVALDEKIHGDEDLRTADAMSELAVLLKNLEKPEEAEPYYRKALAIRRKILGENHDATAQSMNNLAVFLSGQGRYAEAESLAAEAVAVDRRVYGGDHLDVALALTNLAGAQAKNGKPRAAEASYREAIAMTRRTMGDDYWVVGAIRFNFGKLLLGEDRFGEAEAQLVPAYDILSRGLGPDSRRAVLAAERLAAFYETRGRPDRAAHYRALLPAPETEGGAPD